MVSEKAQGPKVPSCLPVAGGRAARSRHTPWPGPQPALPRRHRGAGRSLQDLQASERELSGVQKYTYGTIVAGGQSLQKSAKVPGEGTEKKQSSSALPLLEAASDRILRALGNPRTSNES